jgi:hypothetical protein
MGNPRRLTFGVVLIGCQLSRISDELRERYATGAVMSFELLLLPLRQSPSARSGKRAQIRQDRSARIGLCSLRAQSGKAMTPTSTRGVAIWLMACAMLVYSVLIIGGITRLTHSGLSIVEWQPLVGALPPLSDHAWTTLFEKYRATPE